MIGVDYLIKSNLKTGLKVLTTVTCLSAVCLTPSYVVKATTIDDLRELSGAQRVDAMYTASQQAKILMEYTLIENHNNVAKMLNASNPMDINKIAKTKRQVLNSQIKEKKRQLEKAFKDGASVTSIMSLKSELSNLEYSLEGVAEERPILKMKVKKNPYKSKYFDIVGNIEEIKKYKKIGIVGNNLMSPVKTGFVTMTAFGYRLDKNGGYSAHQGLDLSGREGDTVLNTWNGVVSSVTKNKGKKTGYTVKIRNDKNLDTVYRYVKGLKVSKGDKVSQYDKLGYLSQNKEKLKPHLHYEVLIDGFPVNPVFFYGDRGYKSLENYIMRTDDELSDVMKDLLPRIKQNVLKDKSAPLKSNAFDAKDEVNFARGGGVKKKNSVEVYLDKKYGMPKPKGDFND